MPTTAIALSRGIDPYGFDFAALDERSGRPMGDISLGHNHIGDTPTWLLLFELLAALSPHTAYWLWFWINVGALAASLIILTVECGLRGPPAWVIAALVVMYPPIATNFWFGQSEVLLLLILVLMLSALRRDRQVVAGLLLAAAALLRAYPAGLLGYLLVLRKWRAIGWTLAGILVGAAITTFFVGWPVMIRFVEATGLMRGSGLINNSTALGQPIELARHPNNLNLGWAVKFLFDRTGRNPRAIANILAVVAEAALLGVTLAATWKGFESDKYAARFSLWIITVTLISPLAWAQFMACFMPLFVGLAAFSVDRGRASLSAWLAAASFALISILPPHGYPFPVVLDLASRLFANHHSLLHALPESVPLSLALAWIAAYWFTSEVREPGA